MNTFNFAGAALRTITLDGTPYFAAIDVCKCLGFRDPNGRGTFHHVKKLDDDERRLVTPKQMRGLRGPGATFVTESGLNKLLMRSDKPEAKQFQDWLAREVLPRPN